jgi:hypothetical protein
METPFAREVTSNNLKYLHSVFSLLLRIGRDIVIERSPDGVVTFRALNDTNSVFIAVEFEDNFWIPVSGFIEDETSSFSCKLPTKLVCLFFRNLKKIQSLIIYQRIENIESQLVFKFISSDGVERTHILTYQDCDILNAVFNEEQCNVLQSQPKVFTELIDHLNQAPEIMIEANANNFFIKSCLIDRLDTTKRQQFTTDLNIDISEFDVYEYHPPALEIEDEQIDHKSDIAR